MRECPVAEKFPVRFIGILSFKWRSCFKADHKECLSVKYIFKNLPCPLSFMTLMFVIIFGVRKRFIFHNFQSQYTASVAIQSLVPGGEQTKDPCVIIGNELISAPWEYTIAVSTNGHKNNRCPSFSVRFLCYRVNNTQRSRSLMGYFLLNFWTAKSAISVTFSHAKFNAKLCSGRLTVLEDPIVLYG